jgi:asparagine synthase (glutamine-hydrolysing)
MCGIAGSFGRKLHINQKDILNLNKALMHRGPDYQNYVREKQIFFYHARLSIIDIRNISHQPMYSSDKSLLIVFNGEIYNYIELKNKLSTYNFKTKSDTEVILAAYKKWGKECLDKLSGAFSFCIYDMKKKIFFLLEIDLAKNHFFIVKIKKYLILHQKLRG